MNKYLKLTLMIALFAVVFTAANAFAADNVFETVTRRMSDTFVSVRTVIFIVGGFGLIGLGFAAIFGKVKWPWLAALACGLAIVALAGAVVDYVTQSDSTGAYDSKGDWTDTLVDGGGSGDS